MAPDMLTCLSHPCTTDSLDAVSLIELSLVSRAVHLACQTQTYYKSLCMSYCLFAGVYSLKLRVAPIDYRGYFYDELLRLPTRFNTLEPGDSSMEENEYKIRVACRFRPGCLDSSKLALPLHQFLRVKRQQRQQSEQSPSEFILGQHDPPEFVDPLLGVVMHDPIMLLPSQRVVDRSIAVQCVVRGGRDPFNNQRLTMDMLVPQIELMTRIRAWREANKDRPDVAVDRSEVGFLVEELNKCVNLIDVLRDVEKMKSILQKTKEAAFAHIPKPDDDDEDDDDPGFHVEEQAPQIDQPLSLSELTQLRGKTIRSMRNDEVNASSYESRKKDTAKVISVDTLNSTVTMNIPGRGVYPFYFSAVHDQNATQKTVFDSSVAEVVTASLNGENACVLCYGQVSLLTPYMHSLSRHTDRLWENVHILW